MTKSKWIIAPMLWTKKPIIHPIITITAIVYNNAFIFYFFGRVKIKKFLLEFLQKEFKSMLNFINLMLIRFRLSQKYY